MSKTPTPNPFSEVLEQLAGALEEPGMPRAAWLTRLAATGASLAGMHPLAERLGRAVQPAELKSPPPAGLISQLRSLAHGLRIGSQPVARAKLLQALDAWRGLESAAAAGEEFDPRDAVLLVDAGPVSRALTARLIRKIGVRVFEFMALDAALDALRRGDGRVVIADPLHQRLEPAELVASARAAAGGPVAVYLLIEDAGATEAERPLPEGAAGFLRRPPDEASLRAALSRPPATGDSP